MVMQIGLANPADHEIRPRITVIGCGGAGGNAVNNMIRANLQGVEFVVTNTDSQALAHNLAPRRIQLGASLTRGLGAGAKPEVGRAAAEECVEEIMQELDGSNMVFITAGMGGGTGTGAAPVIARAARERGILTVGVVSKPFQFEGVHRMRLAENGIQDLQQYVDTLIVIPNQNLFRLANERTTFADAFKMADDVLHAGVRGVTDLMMMPGLINLDFADIRTVMSEMGKAMMGTGEATGERRALDAAEAAISNPLLDDASMKGARAVLINITGGLDLTLFEVDEAANRIRDEVDPDSNIIFGATFDESLEGRIRVSVVATGIDTEVAAAPRRPQIVLVTDATNRPPAPNVTAGSRVGSESPPSNGPTFGVTGTSNVAPAAPPNLSQKYTPPLRPQQPPMTASITLPSPPIAPTMDGGFIPPRPIEATIEPAVTQRVTPASNPEPTPSQPVTHGNAALAMQPSSAIPSAQTPTQAKEKARAPSLFERFTNPLSTARRDPTPEAPNPGPSVTISGNSTPPPLSRTAEDDLLEIPAFLRRQAN